MMIFQIYGVKVTRTGSETDKERRYYGDCESEDEASKAVDTLLSTCDYAYAKQIGVGTVLYRESVDHKYPCAPLEPRHLHRQFPGS